MLHVVENYDGFNGCPLRLRVGINSGPVVAGVIGRQKFIYDLWGDAVNVASRMESNGLANQIQVTEAVKEKLAGRYEFKTREPLDIKGKGRMRTYILDSFHCDLNCGADLPRDFKLYQSNHRELSPLPKAVRLLAITPQPTQRSKPS